MEADRKEKESRLKEKEKEKEQAKEEGAGKKRSRSGDGGKAAGKPEVWHLLDRTPRGKASDPSSAHLNITLKTPSIRIKGIKVLLLSY